MSPRSAVQNSACTRQEAWARLQQADAFVLVAELALDDDTDTATPGVAAALAVLAGIAASDAACCARLGRRPRGRDHGQAPRMLGTVEPGGAQMARDLQALLAQKDAVHYGLTLVGSAKADELLARARRLVDHARVVVQG